MLRIRVKGPGIRVWGVELRVKGPCMSSSFHILFRDIPIYPLYIPKP